jgi:hypothetical protein
MKGLGAVGGMRSCGFTSVRSPVTDTKCLPRQPLELCAVWRLRGRVCCIVIAASSSFNLWCTEVTIICFSFACFLLDASATMGVTACCSLFLREVRAST